MGTGTCNFSSLKTNYPIFSVYLGYKTDNRWASHDETLNSTFVTALGIQYPNTQLIHVDLIVSIIMLLGASISTLDNTNKV